LIRVAVAVGVTVAHICRVAVGHIGGRGVQCAGRTGPGVGVGGIGI
jgi:hypothetical protein